MLPIHNATLFKSYTRSKYPLISPPPACKVCTLTVLLVLEKLRGSEASRVQSQTPDPDTVSDSHPPPLRPLGRAQQSAGRRTKRLNTLARLMPHVGCKHQLQPHNKLLDGLPQGKCWAYLKIRRQPSHTNPSPRWHVTSYQYAGCTCIDTITRCRPAL